MMEINMLYLIQFYLNLVINMKLTKSKSTFVTMLGEIRFALLDFIIHVHELGGGAHIALQLATIDLPYLSYYFLPPLVHIT